MGRGHRSGIERANAPRTARENRVLYAHAASPEASRGHVEAKRASRENERLRGQFGGYAARVSTVVRNIVRSQLVAARTRELGDQSGPQLYFLSKPPSIDTLFAPSTPTQIVRCGKPHGFGSLQNGLV